MRDKIRRMRFKNGCDDIKNFCALRIEKQKTHRIILHIVTHPLTNTADDVRAVCKITHAA